MKKYLAALSALMLFTLPLEASQMTQGTSSPQGKAVLSADLQIVNPMIVIDARKPQIVSIKDKLHALASVKITLIVYNAGKKTIQLPTRVATTAVKLIMPGKGTEELPEGTLFCELQFCGKQYLHDQSTGKKILIVRSESSFGTAELRPGEAVIITAETRFPKENLDKIKNVRFSLLSIHDGRYPFWQGRLITRDYPFSGTKNFRILQ